MIATVDHLSGLELCVGIVAFLVVFFGYFAYQIRLAPVLQDERDREAEEAEVTRLPVRLRLVQGGQDTAGDEAASVDFDWHGGHAA